MKSCVNMESRKIMNDEHFVWLVYIVATLMKIIGFIGLFTCLLEALRG